MTQKLVKAWGAGLARSCLTEMAVAALVIPLACLLIVVPLYITQNGQFTDQEQLLILGVSFGLFLLIALGGSVAFGLWLVARRARSLDAAFVPLGLTGSMFFLNGRQYHGSVNGRLVDAYFYRGPALDLYLAAGVHTRLGVGARSRAGLAVAGLLQRSPLAVTDADLQHLSFFAHDPAWARAWLDNPEARAALLRLTAEAGAYELRQIHLQPDAVLLRLYHTDLRNIGADALRRWLIDLNTLARAAEAAPPPAERLEATPLERAARSGRSGLNARVLTLTCAGIAAAGLCIGGAAAAILLLTGRR